MADIETLFEQVDELTPEEKEALYKYLKSAIEGIRADKQPQAVGARILGLHAHLGEAWMSEDFNDELPDEFWFGEE